MTYLIKRYTPLVILPLACLSVLLPGCTASEGNADDAPAANWPGPVVRIEGDQGYDDFKLMEWEDDTLIDARGARWASFGWGVSMRNEKVHPNDTTLNNYPLVVGADWGGGAWPARIDLYNYGNCPPPQTTKLYWLGGIIEGTQPLETTWKQSKAANGGGITLNALDSTIDGVRMHNIHDPFIPLEGNGFTIKNSWVSWTRDDVIENDGFAAGLIDDCLFEENNTFYSARNTRPNSGRQAEAPGGSTGSVVRVQNSLIGLGNLPGANSATNEMIPKPTTPQPGFGMIWKQNDRDHAAGGVDRNPTVDLVNNIFFIPKPFPGCRPGRYDVMPKPAGRIEGNIVIWMGEGDYPFDYDPKQFRVLTGEEGLRYWQKARADWIERHPTVGRVEGDPGYDPARHGVAAPPPPDLLEFALETIERLQSGEES